MSVSTPIRTSTRRPTLAASTLCVAVLLGSGPAWARPAAAARAPATEASPSTAGQRLQAALASLDSEVTAATLRALGGRDTATLLAAIVADPRVAGTIRLRAAASIHTLGDADALRQSRALLRLDALEPRLRWHVGFGAVVLAGRIDLPAALSLASAWLASPDALLRDAAVRALGHVDGDAATRLLERARLDTDAEIRAVATRLLARRAPPPSPR